MNKPNTSIYQVKRGDDIKEGELRYSIISRGEMEQVALSSYELHTDSKYAPRADIISVRESDPPSF